ncbi:hypothetical protein C3729_09850 [Cloacibacterium normanense]|uniref:VWFA domain-containing protein n=1 Tax=Cloacibacterium normanense TaxID=237258 RepID=A0A2S7I3B9_9FLAO|nr:hypothetical protein [Cloacibacterium normanense]PPZ90975.1 hypothetical protein C3729_09850 [Cloacibacterium normanense]
MSFIKRYNKSSNYKYLYSCKFFELPSYPGGDGGENRIFSIGNISGNGLITCSNENGDILWEKSYSIQNFGGLTFHKIIQKIVPNYIGDQYYYFVLGSVSGMSYSNKYIFSINPNNGNIIWCKQIGSIDTTEHVFISANKTDVASFFLCTSDKNQQDFRQTIVSEISVDGNMINQKLLNDSSLIINDFQAYDEGVVLGGRILYQNQEFDTSVGIIINLNTALSITDSFILNPTQMSISNSTIHSVKFRNNMYIASGYSGSTNNLFTFISNIGAQQYKLNTLANSSGRSSQIEYNELNQQIYLLSKTSDESIISLIDENGVGNILWNKRIIFSDNSSKILSLSFNDYEQSIMAVGEDYISSIIINTSSDFNSCKTVEISNNDFYEDRIDVLGYGLDILNSSMNLSSILANTTSILDETQQDLCVGNTSECPINLALVIDESGSISSTEAAEIKNGLLSFINNQLNGNITLSLIGMSNSDSGIRTDHILSKNIKDFKINFENWINQYRNRNVNSESDYWNSGLEEVKKLPIQDLVVIITDGCQVNQISTLKSNYQFVNSNSHIFVYGISQLNNSYYYNGSEFTYNLGEALQVYLSRNSIIKTNTNNILSSDYLPLQNFQDLGSALNELANELNIAQVGCIANLEIVENHLTIPTLFNGITINGNAGRISIKNKSRIPYKLAKNSKIHKSNEIGGLIFTIDSDVDINILPQEVKEINIRITGTPNYAKSYSELIYINDSIKNPSSFKIQFEVRQIIDPNDPKTKLQSPEFFMQAVGSNGVTETKGVHLRWEFGDEFGENHIPKGNLATSTNFYNRPNDFVNVYRAPYNKVQYIIDFSKTPDFVNPLKYYWIYKYADNRSVYVYFKNKTLFRNALSQVSPQTNPLGFIQAYGGIIEVENKVDLFFGAELEISNKNENSSLQLEGLSLAKRDTYNSKVLSYRKLYKSTDLNTVPSLRIENGRSLRFRVKDCQVSKISFEYYKDFISNSNSIGWSRIGSYSLSLDDNLVFSRLEPNTSDNRVHGRWKKYNDDHYVNINNYKHKWNVDPSVEANSWERSIKKTVEKYIELSEIKPKAKEVFNFNQVEPNAQNDDEGGYQSYPDENSEVSNLDLLKLAALDFHVARMLGMGTMDINPNIFDGQYVYIAEYDKKENLASAKISGDELTVKQLSMSLPVSVSEERKPLSVDISEIKFGLPAENPEKSDLYDENGYTKDGKKRVISIYAKESFKYEVYPPFFDSFKEFDASKFTVPIYAGLEHRHYVNAQNPIIWQSPELSHDSEYFIYGSETIGETLPILLAEENKALYVHFHNLKGKYFYASYGIDWFSRASDVPNNPSSEQVKVVITDLKPANTLLPPTGINCQLIKEENPLMFTSVSEQDRLKTIPESSDNTLVRLLFDYNAEQDIKIYNVDSENEPVFPDNEEVFADQIEIFYRSSTPKSITAKVTSLTDLPNNLLLMQVSTNSYTMASTGEVYESKYPSGTSATNFVGGIFLMNQQAYVIDSIEAGTKNLKFNIYKKEASDLLLSGKYSDLSATSLKNKLLLEITQFTNASNTVISDGMFVATENMQTPSNWGIKNPNQLKVKLGNADWVVNKELITITSEDGNTQKFIEKTRGFWKEAIVTEFMEDHALINDEGKYIDEDGAIVSNPVVKKIHKGIYKIEFNNFKLPQHEQFSSNAKSVEWFNGFVRLFKISDINNDGKYIAPRTSLKVFKTENIGDSTKDLILYVIDENFKFDYKTGTVLNPNLNREFLLGNNVLINYYPSYRVYLYSDISNDLTKSKVYGDKDVNYSIFGLRSIDTLYKDNNNLYYASRFCPPSILLAQKTIVPQRPKQPKGALYTTRPDFYGKATYTFQVEFEDNPFAVQFYRADDNTLLNALYNTETIEYINRELEMRGGKNEIAFAERWQDFLNYSEDKMEYEPLPHLGKWGWALPQPDNKELFDNINYFIKQHNSFYKLTESDNRLLTEEDYGVLPFDSEIIKIISGILDKPIFFRDFVKEYLYSAFLPLTEVPVVYDQIYGGDYVPTNKKQNLRDKDGVLLKPNSTQKDANGFVIKAAGDEFEMAPMMKGISDKKVSFTDFTIDATTDSFYFYVAREIGSAMKFGEFSPVIGPVKVVDANAPEAPKINSALPVLGNSVLGITPKIKIEIHAYPDVQKIKRVNLYRTTERINAQAIMHMDLVKTIDISNFSLEDSNIWTIYDEFDSFDKVPYGEAIYYRITVEKRIEYAKADYVSGGENPELVIDYVPSQPSKIISTLIVESQNPESPTPKFVTDEVLENASSINYGGLTWGHTLYRGKYHVYKMSAQGNWSEIAKLEINPSNPNQFTLYRLENGNWNKIEDLQAKSNEIFITLSQLNLLPLTIKDSQGNSIYHHFKVIAENNSNMLSSQENILTIFNNDNAIQLDGISSDGIDGMITDQTFIIR